MQFNECLTQRKISQKWKKLDITNLADYRFVNLFSYTIKVVYPNQRPSPNSEKSNREVHSVLQNFSCNICRLRKSL